MKPTLMSNPLRGRIQLTSITIGVVGIVSHEPSLSCELAHSLPSLLGSLTHASPDGTNGEMKCDPVGIADIAERAGVKEITVRSWRKRHKNFPQQRWTVSNNPVWDWSDVKAWLKKSGRTT